MSRRLTVLGRQGCSVSWQARPHPGDHYRVVRGLGSGDDHRDVVEIFLKKQILQKMLAASRAHSPVECVGLLGGRRGADPGGRYIVIDECVVADGAQAARAHVTLEIDQCLGLRERLAGSQYLGWFHSHPLISAFFSSVDRETQRLASSDWYVGIVVDHGDSARPYRVFFGRDSRELVEATRETPSVLLSQAATVTSAKADRSSQKASAEPCACCSNTATPIRSEVKKRSQSSGVFASPVERSCSPSVLSTASRNGKSRGSNKPRRMRLDFFTICIAVMSLLAVIVLSGEQSPLRSDGYEVLQRNSSRFVNRSPSWPRGGPDRSSAHYSHLKGTPIVFVEDICPESFRSLNAPRALPPPADYSVRQGRFVNRTVVSIR